MINMILNNNELRINHKVRVYSDSGFEFKVLDDKYLLIISDNYITKRKGVVGLCSCASVHDKATAVLFENKSLNPIFVNRDWYYGNESQTIKDFIIYHEQGHLFCIDNNLIIGDNTEYEEKNEFMADLYGILKYSHINQVPIKHIAETVYKSWASEKFSVKICNRMKFIKKLFKNNKIAKVDFINNKDCFIEFYNKLSK